MSPADLGRAWDAAALGAVAVADDEGVLAAAVTPVVNQGVGMLLPFDRTPLALALAAAGRATLATWDSRLALRGWTPLAADVRIDVVEDRDGRWVGDGWLDPLLRTHPPSRSRLDTPLLRREHWWYVPRWVVTVTAVEAVWPIARREGPGSALLASDDGGAVAAAVVEVEEWDADPIRLRADGGLPAGRGAALLAHDVRVPDLDQEAVLQVRGQLDGSGLHVAERSGSPILGPVPSLRRRFGQARALERSCREAIAARELAR